MGLTGLALQRRRLRSRRPHRRRPPHRRRRRTGSQADGRIREHRGARRWSHWSLQIGHCFFSFPSLLAAAPACPMSISFPIFDVLLICVSGSDLFPIRFQREFPVVPGPGPETFLRSLLFINAHKHDPPSPKREMEMRSAWCDTNERRGPQHTTSPPGASHSVRECGMCVLLRATTFGAYQRANACSGVTPSTVTLCSCLTPSSQCRAHASMNAP